MSQLSQLLSKVYVADDGCWLWCGYRSVQGYGQCREGRRKSPAHRAIYRLMVGPIPPGMAVCHVCDNPACVNPEHLWLGTNADNVADRNRKGRQAKGERNGRSKLTREQVQVIRMLADAGLENKAQLARNFKVSRRAIQKIVNREMWGWL